MGYKVSGSINDSARVIVINEGDWSIESNTLESPSSFEVVTASGAKLVIARNNDGEIVGYGNITPAYVDSTRGVFGGGTDGTQKNTLDYLTIATTGDATNFGDLTLTRWGLASCSNGPSDRGVFVGGYWTGGYTNRIDYITISSESNATDFGDIINFGPYGFFAGCSNKTSNRGIFNGGGDADSPSDAISYITINSTGNSQDFGNLTTSRTMPGATSNGANDRGITGGGYDDGTRYNIIDYVTISSTGNANDFGDLTQSRHALKATSNGTNERGVFAAGDISGKTNVMDYITISSTGNALDFGDLSADYHHQAACSNGTNDRGLFGGGQDDGGDINAVEYITISTTGDSTDFGDLTVARRQFTATSNA